MLKLSLPKKLSPTPIFGYVRYAFLLYGGILVLSLCLGCWNKTERPDLDEDKMVKIMADLSVAEAATTQMSGYSKDSLTQVFYNQVFELHGVNAEQYERNLRIYAKDLATMENMVKKIEATFETEKKPAQ